MYSELSIFFEYTDIQNLWDLVTQPYIQVLGSWFYHIMILAVSAAYYMKTSNLTAASIIYTLLAFVASPLTLQAPLGGYLVYISLIVGIALALSSAILDWRTGQYA